MKHLLSGVAIAAVLAIASPVWAQAPMTPGAAPAGGAPAAKAPAEKAPAPKAAAAKQMHHRPMRHMARRHHHMMKMSPGDQMTEQLNREELARLQGGGMAPPPQMAPPPPMQGPRPSSMH